MWDYLGLSSSEHFLYFILWEFLLNSSRLSSFLPPNFLFFLFKKVGIGPVSVSAYPMSICWITLTLSPPTTIKHLSSWLGVQSCANPPLDWDFIWLDLLKLLCMLTQSLGFHMYICPVVPSECSSFMQLSRLHLIVSPPYLTKDLWGLREEGDLDIPFSAKHYKVVCSLSSDRSLN